MALTDVSIANSALLQVGGKRITSFTQNSNEAIVVSEVFDEVRRAVLRAHPWNCAITRADLVKTLATPVFGFSSQFQLPTDCLRVLTLGDIGNPLVANGYVLLSDAARFKIEGDKLVCNDSVAQITYIFENKNPTSYDSLLYAAIAARLAAEIAWPIARSASLVEKKWALFEAKMREARSIDGMEGEHDAFVGDPLLIVR